MPSLQREGVFQCVVIPGSMKVFEGKSSRSVIVACDFEILGQKDKQEWVSWVDPEDPQEPFVCRGTFSLCDKSGSPVEFVVKMLSSAFDWKDGSITTLCNGDYSQSMFEIDVAIDDYNNKQAYKARAVRKFGTDAPKQDYGAMDSRLAGSLRAVMKGDQVRKAAAPARPAAAPSRPAAAPAATRPAGAARPASPPTRPAPEPEEPEAAEAPSGEDIPF